MKSNQEILPMEDDPISVFQKVNTSMVRDIYRPSRGQSPPQVCQISDLEENKDLDDKQTRAQDIIVHVFESDALMQKGTKVTISDFNQPVDIQKFVITPTPQYGFGVGNQTIHPYLVSEEKSNRNTNDQPQQVAQHNSTRLESPQEIEKVPTTTVTRKLSTKKSSKNLSLFDVIIGRQSPSNGYGGRKGNSETNIPSETDKHKRKRTICGWQIPLRWYQILTAIGWIVMIGVSLWYSINSIINYVETNNNPTTSLSYVEQVPLPFPAITICNWNALSSNCSFCGLKLEKVFRADIQVDVPEYLQIAQYKEIQQQDSIFRCYVFNNQSTNIVTANFTGYSGSLSFFVRVPRPTGLDVTDYSRVGLQVSFHENGTMPDLIGETNFAVPRRDNYFMMTRIVTSRLKTTPINPQLVDVRWEPVTSSVELIGANDTLVVISVAYSTLNVNFITEVVTSSIESLFGEVAGFLGLTMGLDMLKILRGVLDVPYSIKDRTLMNLWNTFN